MKKEILTHFGITLFFCIVFVLLKRIFLPFEWDTFFRVALFLGGAILGTFLPDIDHLIYIYLLRPQELTSQRVNYIIGSGLETKLKLRQVFELMTNTREERTQLIFHTAHFQVIFWVLTFLVVSSSGSLFGKGLVLAFGLHLIVDQMLDLNKLDTLDNWFKKINLSFEKEKYMFYWIGNVVILLLLGLVF